ARNEPLERVVEPLPDEPLQPGVAAGALLAKRREVAVPPHNARREEHRPADPCSLFADDDLPPELTQPGGGDEAGHAGARDGNHVKLNVGLCSTYSMRTPSGPHRNAA